MNIFWKKKHLHRECVWKIKQAFPFFWAAGQLFLEQGQLKRKFVLIKTLDDDRVQY